MAHKKQKRYRPSWDKQKMVYDPFGMWVRYAPEIMEKTLLQGGVNGEHSTGNKQSTKYCSPAFHRACLKAGCVACPHCKVTV